MNWPLNISYTASENTLLTSASLLLGSITKFIFGGVFEVRQLSDIDVTFSFFLSGNVSLACTNGACLSDNPFVVQQRRQENAS
jgi:hypothetical protein